jgi:MoxR-like ATPase
MKRINEVLGPVDLIETTIEHPFQFRKQASDMESTTEAAAIVKRPVRAAKPPNPLRDKILTIEKDLRARIVERDRAIHGLLVAALAGEHVLLIGPPGTAKSQLARGFAQAISGATYFEWLLTKFTTPEELYGPISLAGLKTDQFRRVTTGKLPEAHTAFLDEIFKANSAVLNSLLSSVNERVFHDDGQAKKIPLIMCVGASNELPDSQDLAAIYDRFVMRFHVDPIAEQASFLAMLKNEPREKPEPITFEEWAQVREQVEAVTISDQMRALLFSMRSNLIPAGVRVSDRRWVKATKILQAQAWLMGSSTVGSSHLQVLTDMLWDRPDQLPSIQTVVGAMGASEITAAKRIMDGMRTLTEQTRGYTGQQWMQSATNLRVELKKAITRIEQERDKSNDETVAEELDAMIEELKAQGRTITAKMREDLNMGF